MPEFILHKPAPTRHTPPMNAHRILTPSLLAGALFSCAPSKSDNYDTTRPPVTAPAAQTAATDTPSANPVYDTPAAYEESTAATPAAANLPSAASSKPSNSKPAKAKPVAANSAEPGGNGAATIHVVVAGDTLGKISKHYKVPIASIKQANHMTNDVVVLGRKMVIPPH